MGFVLGPGPSAGHNIGNYPMPMFVEGGSTRKARRSHTRLRPRSQLSLAVAASRDPSSPGYGERHRDPQRTKRRGLPPRIMLLSKSNISRPACLRTLIPVMCPEQSRC